MANNLYVKLPHNSHFSKVSYLQIHHFEYMNFAHHHFLTKTMTQYNFSKFLRIGKRSALTRIFPNALRRVM